MHDFRTSPYSTRNLSCTMQVCIFHVRCKTLHDHAWSCMIVRKSCMILARFSMILCKMACKIFFLGGQLTGQITRRVHFQIKHTFRVEATHLPRRVRLTRPRRSVNHAKEVSTRGYEATVDVAHQVGSFHQRPIARLERGQQLAHTSNLDCRYNIPAQLDRNVSGGHQTHYACRR